MVQGKRAITIHKKVLSINLENIGVFLLLFGPYTVYLSSTIFFGISNMSFVVLLLGLIVFIYSQHGRIVKDIPSDLVVLFTYAIVIIRNQSLANGRFSYLFFYSIVVLISIVSKGSIRWIPTVLAIMRGYALIYAIATILFSFTPSFYVGTVTKLFGNYRMTAIQQYNAGSMPGLTANCSTNAMYLCIGLGVSVAYIFSALLTKKIDGCRAKLKKEIIVVVIEVIALLLTGKRGPILFLVCSLCVLYLICLCKEKVIRWFKIVVILLVVIVVFFVTIAFVPALGRFYYRMLELLEEGNILTGRQMYYNVAFEMFLSHKLFGIGWGGMEIEISRVTWNNAAYNVHNIYLQLLAETGLVGFCVFTIFFLSNLINTVRYTMIKIKSDNVNNIYALMFSCFMQFFFLFYGCTGNPLYDIQILFPYFFCISMTTALRKRGV